MSNTLGSILKLTTFGESHGPAVGGVIDGCPPGLHISEQAIRTELDRRRTGNAFFSSPRKEEDKVEFLSGLLKGRTTGAPIAFIVRNKDVRPEDYRNLSVLFRPSHADFTWHSKYGIRDVSGGGRASARALLPCVVAGVVARSILKQHSCSVLAWVSAIGPYSFDKVSKVTLNAIESSTVRCPDKKTSEKILNWLKEIHAQGDTAGGIITCKISGCLPGLGEPVFGKLNAALAHAMMSINSVKGFEYGSGFASSAMKGSDHNDKFIYKDGHIRTLTNNDGGIQGGISNGEDILFRVAFKPISSIGIEQQTVNKSGKKVNIRIRGRHDACVVPRAVPIVEALAGFVMADHYLLQKTNTRP